MEESIYIVLTQTGTNIAKFIRFFTKKPYNHASISRNPDLSEMYSFCRNYTRTPLPATFNKENVGKGVLGLFSYIPCEIYEVKMTPDQKEKSNIILNHFIDNRKTYSFNVFGFWSIPLNLHLVRKNKFVCSQFVAYVLHKSGIKLKKPVNLYSPDDLRHLPEAALLYKGELNNYHKSISKPISYESNILSIFKLPQV